MEEEKNICNNACGATYGATSSQFIRQKLLVSLFLEREKLKEKNKLNEKNKISEKKEELCSKNITEHLHSECCITVDPNDSSLENCIVTSCCLPFKIVLCFPCHIGSGINSILNYLCNTDKNYLI
jgi:hypothetical protein